MDEARAEYERLLRALEADPQPNHDDIAIALHNLGLLEHQRGARALARSYYERALDHCEASGTPGRGAYTACTLPSL